MTPVSNGHLDTRSVEIVNVRLNGSANLLHKKYMSENLQKYMRVKL